VEHITVGSVIGAGILGTLVLGIVLFVARMMAPAEPTILSPSAELMTIRFGSVGLSSGPSRAC
jgi:hypothetical protein